MREGTRKEFWFRTFITAAVLIVAGVGYYAVDSNSRADAERAAAVEAQRDADIAAAADALCERLSEKSQALVDIGIVLSQDTPIQPEDPPDAVARIELSNQRKADTRRIIAELSAPDACRDGVLPPSRAGDYKLEPE